MHTVSLRPSKGTETGRVWQIADELTRSSRTRAKRADVIRTFVNEGGNPNTAATEYQKWKTWREAATSAPAQAATSDAEFIQLEIKEAGRLLLPANVRTALGVGEGDTLVGELVDGELRLMSRAVAVRRAQALVRRYVPEGVSLVDELIAERRAEARREEAEAGGGKAE